MADFVTRASFANRHRRRDRDLPCDPITEDDSNDLTRERRKTAGFAAALAATRIDYAD